MKKLDKRNKRMHNIYTVSWSRSTDEYSVPRDPLEKKLPDIWSWIFRVEKKEYYPLSSAPKRLYVLQHMEPQGIRYNMPMLVTIKGIPDKERLEKSFQQLICRHETFRTSFEMMNGTLIQKIHGAEEIEFHIKLKQK
jgi:hypothetical protein